MILMYIFAGVLILCFAAGFFVSQRTLKPAIIDYDKSYENEKESELFDDQWFKGLAREDVYIQSDDGLRLHAIWFPCDDSLKSIILSHGYVSTLYGSVKYMKLFRERGFNILLTDHRSHGLSEGRLCTLGHKEKMDHLKWVNWIEHKVGRDTVIGTHGESMGAATMLLHGALDERIRFIIADCSFQNLQDLIRNRLKVDYKLPAFPLLYLGSLVSRIRAGMFFNQVSPLDAVKAIKSPVLFIHGQNDDFIMPSHSINLHKAKRGPGFLYLAPGAEHTTSYDTDPENYRKVVHRFLDNAGV